ncbi:IclR family transcriptional regulator [Dactylosporangium sp. NPDC051484]|uniref:IclR family transcriptional regulator n=1 Tax=Dactylosporangium sp. NPDC051484 TaxID=3154942 RepID=UPI0034504A66
MEQPLKSRPAYAIASVDNALRIAAALQLEGPLTVSEVAARLNVATSTAHRLLQMLVYRDFAVQDDNRRYRVGPVLELSRHSPSLASRLRAAALPQLRRVVDRLDESANLAIRSGATVRFIASVESSQALRVGSREGMVFPAHRTTAGLLLLAELSDEDLAELYGSPGDANRATEHVHPATLRSELAAVRRSGVAVNRGRSERGITAVGVPVRDANGTTVAGIAVSMPDTRYREQLLPSLVAVLRNAAVNIEHAMAYDYGQGGYDDSATATKGKGR